VDRQASSAHTHKARRFQPEPSPCQQHGSYQGIPACSMWYTCPVQHLPAVYRSRRVKSSRKLWRERTKILGPVGIRGRGECTWNDPEAVSVHEFHTVTCYRRHLPYCTHCIRIQISLPVFCSSFCSSARLQPEPQWAPTHMNTCSHYDMS